MNQSIIQKTRIFQYLGKSHTCCFYFYISEKSISVSDDKKVIQKLTRENYYFTEYENAKRY